ncbi:MAG: hypothetical protein AAGG68_27570 [Bacteroidota bacterium]
MDIIQIENILTTLYTQKQDVTLDDIPVDLQKDFTSFFIGKTFTIKKNIPHFHFHDFEEWYNKVVYLEGITN